MFSVITKYHKGRHSLFLYNSEIFYAFTQDILRSHYTKQGDIIMDLRTDNPLNSERAVHYKLYKSGKLWIVMGLSVISFIGSTALTTTFAHADNKVPNQTVVNAAKSKASTEATDSSTTSQSSDQTSLAAPSSNSATTASVQATTIDSTANSNNQPTSQVSTTAVNAASSQATSQIATSAVSKSQAYNQIASSTAATPNTKPATQVRLMATSSAAMKIKPITYKIQSKQMTRNQYQWKGSKLYYYGNDGQPITGLRHYGNNKLEYYGNDHVQYRNRYLTAANNQLYYFGGNGDAITGLRHYGNNKLEYYGADHVQYRNRYYTAAKNKLYYFGGNGDAITGLRYYGNNKLEFYGTDHIQYRNRYATVGNHRYYFGSNGDAVSTNQPQTEADIIGSMRVAQKAQQIVTVVQNGGSTATLKLWQKQGNTWRNLLTSSSRIGNGGIGNSHEGSSTTPKGVYHLSFAFGKGATARTAGMSYRQIKSNSYWIEDQNDRQYNTWQNRNWANNKNEHLIDYTKAAPHNQYELAVVMDNHGQNNGSGFFIHVKNQWPTEGCVSINLSDMRTLIRHLGTKAYVVDVQNQSQLKNY